MSKTIERNLFLYLTVIIILATVVIVYFSPKTYPLLILRWIAGSVFILYLQGLIVVKCFLRDIKLDRIEHFTLSIGLSMVIVVVVAFLISYTPWKISLDSILGAFAIFDICVVLIDRRRISLKQEGRPDEFE